MSQDEQFEHLASERQPAWHALPAEEVLSRLTSHAAGLSDEDASRRRDLFGPNVLPEGRRTSVVRAFLRQFKDPLIYILLAAGVVSVVLAHFGDAGFIFVVLLLNATIGVIQEWKAETSAQALKQKIHISTTVVRENRARSVGSSELVPGDIVLLTSGEAVPADIRLLKADSLRTDESLLTGESTPVPKRAGEVLKEDAPLADRLNVAFAGSSVMEGRATGVVCQTGRRTEIGRIAESLAEGRAEVPPLVQRMRRMSRIIGIFIVGAIAVLGAVLLWQGEPLLQIFFLAVALAVAAIPEGLPVAITVALSVASRRMARRKVIVRRLPAVEGLGSCTLIASDKTGTLTANELTVKRLCIPGEPDVEVTGAGRELEGKLLRDGTPVEGSSRARIEELIRAGALCNEARLTTRDGDVRVEGDSVDVAFLVLAAKLGRRREQLLDEFPQIAQIPYEPQRRFAASFHQGHDGTTAYVKGAAEAVLPMCGDIDGNRLRAEEERLAAEGFRVLALTAGPVSGGRGDQGHGSENLHGLQFLGLVGLIDPIRTEVPDAVARCRAVGIEVRMITGDHPATGLAIARQLGIAEREEEVLTGMDLDRLKKGEKTELDRRIDRTRVYARVAPGQKTTIVEGLQRKGHFVAVTGDGVNDAPALRMAHIGVAMGKSGTDVARGASDLILSDDNFASIVNGIEEGRIAYDNVRKVTWLLIATGAGEIVLFFLALIARLPLPLHALQLLWLNLVTNGIQDVAIAFEKGERGVLDRPPCPPEQGIFDRWMTAQTVVSGAYMGGVAFAFFYWEHAVLGLSEFEVRNHLLLLMVMFENAHAFNCRSETESAFRVPLRNNWLLVAAVVGAHGIHLLAMFVPGLNDTLEIAPIDVAMWLKLAGVASSLILVMEIFKLYRRAFRTHPGGTRHAAPRGQEFGHACQSERTDPRAR